ncbi:MAG: restriction endonuclease [Aestuariivirga sp.]
MTLPVPPKVPTYDKLLWPVLNALKVMGGSASNEELLAKVIEVEKLPEAVQAVIHTDHRQSRLSYNLAWAKTYLKFSGAINNSTRGVWSITDAGEKLTEQDCKQIPATVRRQAYEHKKSRGPQSAEEHPLPAEATGEESWKDGLLAVLRKMTADAFERLAQRLLREAGFIKVEVSGRSGDGGIDGLGVLRVNLLSFQVLFQCKRYQGTVGAPVVRDFRGAMVGRCDKGLIITTGTFSADATREATRDGAPAIDLIDGDLLCDLLKQLKLGVDVEMVERAVVNADWFSKV